MRLGGPLQLVGKRARVVRLQPELGQLKLKQTEEAVYPRGRSERYDLQPLPIHDAGVEASARLVVLDQHGVRRQRRLDLSQRGRAAALQRGELLVDLANRSERLEQPGLERPRPLAKSLESGRRFTFPESLFRLDLVVTPVQLLPELPDRLPHLRPGARSDRCCAKRDEIGQAS